ncbi:GNAT family N-acetyltransferase [Marinicellulosiphila megalodicopiae]|uniref:GNAT family N-acetyltransferase n=1 Tax=Marinicellulosiphila megalodicopiae TaxID=2724896 RepID=UPI003BAEC997
MKHYRKAQPKDAQALTDLIRKAKAHWGYPDEWMAQWEPLLTMTSDWIEKHNAVLLLDKQKIIGFYGIEFKIDHAYLEHLWVNPDWIGTGCGKALFIKACEDAKNQGFTMMELSADPNALGFYLHMNAVKVGDIRSSICGVARILPTLRIDLNT